MWRMRRTGDTGTPWLSQFPYVCSLIPRLPPTCEEKEGRGSVVDGAWLMNYDGDMAGQQW